MSGQEWTISYRVVVDAKLLRLAEDMGVDLRERIVAELWERCQERMREEARRLWREGLVEIRLQRLTRSCMVGVPRQEERAQHGPHEQG